MTNAAASSRGNVKPSALGSASARRALPFAKGIGDLRVFLGVLAPGFMMLTLVACGGGADLSADPAEVSASRDELGTSSCVGQTSIPGGVQHYPCAALADAQCTAANGCGWQEYHFSNCGSQATGPYIVYPSPLPGPQPPQAGPEGGYCYQYSYRICSGTGGADLPAPSTTVDCSTFAAADCAQHSGCSLAPSPGYCGRTSVQNCERAVGGTCCALDHTLYLCTDNGWSSRAPC